MEIEVGEVYSFGEGLMGQLGISQKIFMVRKLQRVNTKFHATRIEAGGNSSAFITSIYLIYKY